MAEKMTDLSTRTDAAALSEELRRVYDHRQGVSTADGLSLPWQAADTIDRLTREQAAQCPTCAERPTPNVRRICSCVEECEAMGEDFTRMKRRAERAEAERGTAIAERDRLLEANGVIALDCGAAKQERDALRRALAELHTLVWGECSSLLNEDSGGWGELDKRIVAALTEPREPEAARTEPREMAPCPCGKAHSWNGWCSLGRNWSARLQPAATEPKETP